MSDFFPDFEPASSERDGVRIHALRKGSGPPLLLLHGYPETHVMWHRIAESLTKEFTVVLADLRGYGDSDKPPGDDTHATYSKREMAADQVALMSSLGFESFSVAGHDRGARVTHRLCLDHPERVSKAAVLDIAPTAYMYATADDFFGRIYYHWYFFIQPFDIPERLIGADPDYYLRTTLRQWTGGADIFPAPVLDEYARCFSDPAAVHASCEDYRAAATIDLEHDAADADARVACPLLVLWGSRGFVGIKYDVLDVWRNYAMDVSGQDVDAGHFLTEEAPDETLAAMRRFFHSD